MNVTHELYFVSKNRKESDVRASHHWQLRQVQQLIVSRFSTFF